MFIESFMGILDMWYRSSSRAVGLELQSMLFFQSLQSDSCPRDRVVSGLYNRSRHDFAIKSAFLVVFIFLFACLLSFVLSVGGAFGALWFLVLLCCAFFMWFTSLRTLMSIMSLRSGALPS